ncbi:MAG: transglutaminase family protein, partial [Moorea sp. SIO2B7]|nr:transglutaminase family protein [Moorena sp. SIO2B7]
HPSYAAPVSGSVIPVKPTLETGKAVKSQMEINLSLEGS